MANMLIFFHIVYYFWLDIDQNSSICNRIWDSRMANMLIFFDFMYNVGSENGQHDDVLVFVVLSWIWEWSKWWCSSICCISLEPILNNMLILHHFVYDAWFENGQSVDVLAFVVVFGILEWPTCWSSVPLCTISDSRMVNMLMS